MSVLVQNQGANVEYIDIKHVVTGKLETVTVQPGGRVTLPRGYKVNTLGVNLPHIHISGNDAPVSTLQL